MGSVYQTHREMKHTTRTIVIFLLSQSLLTLAIPHDDAVSTSRIRNLCNDQDLRLVPPHIRAICEGIAGVEVADQETTTLPTLSTSSVCDILCPKGTGGALCDCGDYPPAEHIENPEPKQPLNCRKLCKGHPNPPKACNCVKKRLGAPQPPVGPAGSLHPVVLCKKLCSAGRGGSLCDCDGFPPAIRAEMSDDETTTTTTTTAAPVPQPPSTLPAIDCKVLCSDGRGGSLCDCGGMPPAMQFKP